MSNSSHFEQLYPLLCTNATAHASDLVLDEDDCAAIVFECAQVKARAEKAEAELAAYRRRSESELFNAETVIGAYRAGEASLKLNIEQLISELKSEREQACGFICTLTKDKTELEAQLARKDEALILARPYLESASNRLYDGGDGAGIRATAKARLAVLQSALATGGKAPEPKPKTCGECAHLNDTFDCRTPGLNVWTRPEASACHKFQPKATGGKESAS